MGSWSAVGSVAESDWILKFPAGVTLGDFKGSTAADVLRLLLLFFAGAVHGYFSGSGGLLRGEEQSVRT